MNKISSAPGVAELSASNRFAALLIKRILQKKSCKDRPLRCFTAHLMAPLGILFAAEAICLRMGFHMKRAQKSAGGELRRLIGPLTDKSGLNSHRHG